MPKEYRTALGKRGIRIIGTEVTKGGHLRLSVTDGHSTLRLIAPMTLSDYRGIRNMVAFARRGFRVELSAKQPG